MTKQKQSKSNEAFGLLFGAEDTGYKHETYTPKQKEEFHRNPNATECYLVVKTGNSGTKINDLYNTTINVDDREIKLAGKHRLQGPWLRSITDQLKQNGITGTVSIFNHTIADAEELINEHQKMMIKLAKDIDWKVVARVNLEEKELDELIKTLGVENFENELAEGRVTGSYNAYRHVKFDKYKTTSNYQNNKLINECRLEYKHRQADYIGQRIGKYIELVK
jgi:hypothetical protein